MASEDIKLILTDFSFQGYQKAVEKLLRAYGILETTVTRIISKIAEGETGPLYVYRRAVIYCCSEDNYEERIGSSMAALPLILIFQPSKIIILNNNLGKVECPYEELRDYLEYLQPLQSWDANRNDQYSTQELDSLVESLYRELKMSDNDEENIRSFLFSLLYIAHFTTLLEIEAIKEVLKEYTPTDEKKLANIFSTIKGYDIPFISSLPKGLVISKEAYKYIFAIARFDTNLIDAEYLTSLIYRMTNREESGIFGHQTALINVEKLLQPLFLDFMQRLANESTTETVFKVVNEIYEAIVFDPTNSPGCFLVAAYNGFIQQLRDIEVRFDIKCKNPLDLSHFIGLVSNNLTKSLSKLSLVFTHTRELKRLGILNKESISDAFNALNIEVADELKTDWHSYVIPNENLFIVGSPEFKGCNKISAERKKIMQQIYGCDVLHNADFCSAWLVKAAKFIAGTKAKAAFVLTNSVSQGEQSTFILDKIVEAGCEYIFAHRSFKWKVSNDNTGITVVIIGIAATGEISTKLLFEKNTSVKCGEIGASLLPDINIRIERRTSPLSKLLPHMRKGNMPDGAVPLTFTREEKNLFLEAYPQAEKFMKLLYGGDEFVSGIPKWVLWIEDKDLAGASLISGIKDRIEQVKAKRTSPKSTSSKNSRENPHKFRETNVTSKGKVSLIVPCVTSENREYFQMGILGSNAILNNNVSVIFDCDIWLLALLESRMHMVWAKNAAGGHEQRPRYSSALCYNTFPFPEISSKQIATLRNLARTLLEVREKYCNKSLGDLYKNMPPELKRVHFWIDETVDSYYRNQPFESDAERLMWLKNLYNNMTENE